MGMNASAIIASQLPQIQKYLIQSSDLLLDLNYQERRSKHKNEFAKKHAAKHFSQTDEDGITLEILRRLKKVDPDFNNRFVEFGVGDGLENNTLVLLSLGWSGCWFGGEELAFDNSSSKRLNFYRTWITKDNVASMCSRVLSDYLIKSFTVASLDLDGNDYYIIECILSAGYLPSLFICEYNALFPAEAQWSIEYDENFSWVGGPYFGTSLGKLVNLFSEFGYFLCACNIQTGANAFFVKNKFRPEFPDVSNDINDIYAPPYYKIPRFHHGIDARLVSSIIS